MPPGVVPDVRDGTTWIGVVGLRMTRVRVAGARLPYIGDFLETNVRAYSVDGKGRRGVVFLAMEASRLTVVLGARTTAHLPYHWASMTLRRRAHELDYATLRRWPRAEGARLRFRVSADDGTEGTPLEHFLTDRWGLHVRHPRGTRYLPLAHGEWSLRSATLVDLADGGLLAAAGLPQPCGQPVSVLYAPVMAARIGRPIR